jgi:hypothetical protein
MVVAISVRDFERIRAPLAGITAKKHCTRPHNFNGAVCATYGDDCRFTRTVARANYADVISARERYVFGPNRACLS